jgi:uridine phosphorylase
VKQSFIQGANNYPSERSQPLFSITPVVEADICQILVKQSVYMMPDESRSRGNSGGEDEEGHILLKNPNIGKLEEDVLYHFALSTKEHDMKAMFGDVRFVCVGGSPRRMENFAHQMLKELKYNLPAGQALVNIASATDRYALYKVGPVLAASHGMGIPSISIMLHELIKLVHHAGCQNITFLRIGTSGGIGLKPGTVVISESAVDALLEPKLDLAILGKVVSRPSVLDRDLAKELASMGQAEDDFDVLLGKTMCTLDFYEGQGRLDGAFCDYTEEEKMAFLKHAYDQGVRNIEMESLCFAAMCSHANIKGAVACVTLLDRLKGDQISTPASDLKKLGERPVRLVARFIRSRLGLSDAE